MTVSTMFIATSWIVCMAAVAGHRAVTGSPEHATEIHPTGAR
jgi:hypothetical protein